MKHYSDEQINAYFLGKMPAHEAEGFELECAADAELTEHAQAVERELADRYLRGNLSAEDIECFETHYLTTEARRNRLSAAGVLWQIAAEQPRSVAAAPGVSVWQKIFGKRNAFRLAFASCAALLVCGAIAFYLLSLDVGKTDVAEVREPNQPAKIETPPVENPDDPALKNAPDVSSITNKEIEKLPETTQKNQPETKPAPTQKNIEQIKPALVATVKLLPGSLRNDGEQFVSVAPNAKSVKLLLSPAGEPNDYKIYRAVLKSPETGTVFTSPNLKSLSVTIPTEKLENRTYMIFLEGQNADGEFESISEYTFRVRR